MQVSLRIGNLNAMRMKQVPYPQQHLVLYIRTAVHRILDPDAYLKVHGTVPEAFQQADGRGVSQHPFNIAGRLPAQLDGLVHIGLIVNAQGIFSLTFSWL